MLAENDGFIRFKVLYSTDSKNISYPYCKIPKKSVGQKEKKLLVEPTFLGTFWQLHVSALNCTAKKKLDCDCVYSLCKKRNIRKIANVGYLHSWALVR